jgi:UDP-N-acetylmuramoyl-L-alanyl-D-glutamate--2,6-diaminopimelate ligase
MKLRELLATVEGIESINIPDIDIQGLKTNSHACTVGDLFIGMPGSRVDGGEFWPGALAAGAVAAIVSSEAMQKIRLHQDLW